MCVCVCVCECLGECVRVCVCVRAPARACAQASIDGAEPDLLNVKQPSTYKDMQGPRLLPVPGNGYSQVVSTILSQLTPEVVKKKKSSLRVSSI